MHQRMHRAWGFGRFVDNTGTSTATDHIGHQQGVLGQRDPLGSSVVLRN